MGVHFLTQYRNPLAYPAGIAPAFDPNHVGAAGGVCRFSAVPFWGNAVDILRGQPGVPTLISPAVKNLLGPAIDNSNAGSDAGTIFAGHSTNNDTVATLAGFIYWTTNGSPAIMFTSSSTALAGASLCTGAGALPAQLFLQVNNGTIRIVMPSFTFVANRSYFVAISFNAANVNFVTTDLVTGKIETGTAAFSGTLTAPNGTYSIGGAAGLSARATNGFLGPIMFSTAFLSLPALRQWAADPWSFWFPNPGDNYFGISAGGLFKITGNPMSLAGFGGGLAA